MGLVKKKQQQQQIRWGGPSSEKGVIPTLSAIKYLSGDEGKILDIQEPGCQLRSNILYVVIFC